MLINWLEKDGSLRVVLITANNWLKETKAVWNMQIEVRLTNFILILDFGYQKKDLSLIFQI